MKVSQISLNKGVIKVQYLRAYNFINFGSQSESSPKKINSNPINNKYICLQYHPKSGQHHYEDYLQKYFIDIDKIYTPKRIKRKIPIKAIYGITYSNIGNEFVIHVPTEYDFRYISKDRREILLNLIKVFMKLNKVRVPFFFKDEFTLVQYTTTKEDKKKASTRMPQEVPELLDDSEFIERVSNKFESELLFQKSKNNSTKVSLDDFTLIKVLGKGAFGKVMLCEKKDTKELFAIKSLRKENIVEKNQIEHTKSEKQILQKVNNQFLVSLDYAFQTKNKIFFVMKFMRGGELFHHLQRLKRFPEKTAMFYTASLIYAIEYLHKMNVVYRDIKPENILLDEDGYLQITDFGLAKYIPHGLTYSFVGTPEYLAPELLQSQGHSFEVDWWGLGILIFEMIVGRPPFLSGNFPPNQSQLFEMILKSEVKFPTQPQMSNEVKSIIIQVENKVYKQLLEKNPSERLGHLGDGEEIRSHEWFKSFNFEDLLSKKMKAPIIPDLNDKFDVKYFDEEFTNQEPINSFVESDKNVLKQFGQDFGGVTYMPIGIQEK